MVKGQLCSCQLLFPAARLGFTPFKPQWSSSARMRSARQVLCCPAVFLKRFASSFRVAALQTDLESASIISDSGDTLDAARSEYSSAWPTVDTVVRYAGRGVQLGLDVQWSLLLRPDGAFVEEWQSRDLRSVVGHDGGADSRCWEIDGMGLPKTLELDDHEHCLMSNWVRSGFWASPDAEGRLEIALAEQLEPPRTADMQHDPESPASSSSRSTSQGQCLALKLRDGEVVGSLQTASRSWQPEDFQIRIFGKVDRHTFADWRLHGSHWFPREYTHEAAAGSVNRFTVESHGVLGAWRPDAFRMPESALRPPDATFEPEGGGDLPAWWTASGHIVVQPSIDGQEIGYMILDTGASGFVIERAAADRLGLSRFGEFHCSGMMGNVQICARRGASISLGPLTIRDPLFMEMELGGLVRGAPGDVIGIAGFDVFRRSVLDIPFSATRQGRFDIRMTDPEAYAAPTALEPFWHSLEFVSSLPLIRASIGAKGASHDVRLMIDSGAGGVDLMFNKRATDELGLLKDIPSSTRLIKGVGGSLTEKQRVKSGLLAWMRVAESRFERLDCLFIGSAGLDLSHYVQGIICGELVARCRAVLDFARARIALLPGGVADAVPAPRTPEAEDW